MMNRVREQLITVEAATRMSYGESGGGFYRNEPESIWAWQTVAGALSQKVSDQALSQMAARAWKKR